MSDLASVRPNHLERNLGTWLLIVTLFGVAVGFYTEDLAALTQPVAGRVAARSPRH